MYDATLWFSFISCSSCFTCLTCLVELIAIYTLLIRWYILLLVELKIFYNSIYLSIVGSWKQKFLSNTFWFDTLLLHTSHSHTKCYKKGAESVVESFACILTSRIPVLKWRFWGCTHWKFDPCSSVVGFYDKVRFLIIQMTSTTSLCSHIFGPQGSWSVHVCCLHLKMEFRSCTRGRQWCGIIHYYWWTTSIKPRLLFSRAGNASWGLSLSPVFYRRN